MLPIAIGTPDNVRSFFDFKNTKHNGECLLRNQDLNLFQL
jgi:hypothetical protein